MGDRERIEFTRSILHSAAGANVETKVLLRISRVLDKYIVDYCRKAERQAGNKPPKEGLKRKAMVIDSRTQICDQKLKIGGPEAAAAEDHSVPFGTLI